MVLVTTNRAKQLLYLGFAEQVSLRDLVSAREQLAQLSAELSAGFRVVTDLSRLDSVPVDGASEIGKIMEMCDASGVGLVVRVIPDPRKDIGWNIVSFFHYHHRPRTVTCRTLSEAAEILGL